MITFIRNRLLNAYTALPLLMCLLLTTWSAQARPLTTKHRYSGEEMFRGLFFLEGRYAQALPELQSLSLSYSNKMAKAADKATVDRQRHQILAAIRAERPAFFDEFRRALESGNHLKIQAALRDGRQQMTGAVERLYKVDASQLARLQAQTAQLAKAGKLDQKAIDKLAKDLKGKSDETKPDNGTCVVLLLPMACTIILLCAVVTMYVATSEDVLTADSRLMTEQLVASISRLAASAS
ncbi:hypothetical protein [Tellurirhabdus rosea]|uniref:hypothetical protein n=1 Tax=Tellurirhabdus rosea TaxID=2674997 RepID=UPI00224E58F2|nr:hypothetical protein [Tellurirhabdus rosea]